MSSSSCSAFGGDVPPLTRRHFLNRGAMGFGGLALAGVMQQERAAASPWAPKPTHFEPKAKSVIFLYMDGGVSQVDSFDPKPLLAKENGQKPKFKVDATVFNNNGNMCSVFFDVNPNIACSAYNTNTACSVLPPSAGASPSQCSTFTDGIHHECSTFGNVNNLRCTTKGAGQSRCSTFTGPAGGQGGQCSVFNPGSQNRSFCSTKFNQPTFAKNCSAFNGGSVCSIVVGGAGICTTFGAALPDSCSAFVGNAHCSVLGGAPGTFCVQ